jgi:myo-inositol-1(or 4)-monophosphatase
MKAGEMSEFLEVARSAVLQAGEVAHRRFGKSPIVRHHDDGDVTTETDLEIERQITEALAKAFPAHGFLAEESVVQSLDSEYVWILDPIDGTNYFVRGVPLYSISLALRRNNELLLGIVYAIESNQLFSACRDAGAFLNGEPIRCSEGKSLSEAMLCVEIPNRHAPQEVRRDALAKVAALMDSCQRQRMIGVSAFGLCACAAGGFDGYVNLNKNSKIWDLAAGQVIFREAGGKMSKTRQGYLVGGSPSLHDELFNFINV